MMVIDEKIRGLVLDFGGTIDTNGCHWGKMLWHCYQQVGMPVTENQFREAYVYGERALEMYPMILPDYTFRNTLEVKLRIELEQLCVMGAWNADETMFKKVHQALLDIVYHQVSTIISRNREVLQALYKKYPMVLATNFYGNMHQVLKEFQLDELFIDVIESAVVSIRKPDIRIFKLAVEALGLQPEDVLVVGDSFYKDVEPSCKIGCQTAWLKGEGWVNKQYDESIPTYILTDFQQLVSQ